MPGGRSNRGGRRASKPGAVHANRTDLNTASPPVQSPKAQTGQQYGTAQQQLQAQAVVPLPTAAAPTTTPAFQTTRGPDGKVTGLDRVHPAPSGVPAGGLPAGLADPTTEPDTPLTAGIDSGPGQGSAALGLDDGSKDIRLQVQALYRKFPLSDLAELITEME